jgi:hypothetical protein
MLHKIAVSLGFIGFIPAFIAFVDLINFDKPRHLPVEIYWVGVVPLAVAFLLLPFLLGSHASLTKQANIHNQKLDKTMKDHLAEFKAARERNEIGLNDPASKEYESKFVELQDTLASQSEYTASIARKIRVSILKTYAVFGLALGVLITRMLVNL